MERVTFEIIGLLWSYLRFILGHFSIIDLLFNSSAHTRNYWVKLSS